MKRFERVKSDRSLAAALALVALTLAAPTAARAQWTTNTPANKTTTDDAVGVGTDAPDNALTVRRDQAYNSSVGVPSMTQVQVRNDNGAGFASFSIWSGAERGRLQYNAASPNLFLTTRDASTPLYLGTNNSIRLTVDGATGHVGVGTTSPANALHVHNAFTYGAMRVSGAGLGAINFQDTSAPANQQLYQWRSEGGAFRMSLSNDAGTALVRQNILVATAGGNVGVGTANPIRGPHTSGANHTVVAEFVLENTGMAANHRRLNLWGESAVGAGQFYFRLLNDAGDGVTRQFMTFDNATGSVVVGPTAPAAPTHTLEVTGTIHATGAITGGSIQATYQDMAEWVPSVQQLAAGTVVVLDAGQVNHVVASAGAYDTKVAGVVSAQPGVILGVGGEGKVMVATTGRVKVKVDATRGAIRVGDLLVTSEVEGVAMRSVPVDLSGISFHRPGTIIGKALEPLATGTGEILVLLSLQ